MIVCYDNTVNRQKLADVDCRLDTVRIPTGSRRERRGQAEWLGGWPEIWSQGDAIPDLCVRTQPRIYLHFIFHKPYSLCLSHQILFLVWVAVAGQMLLWSISVNFNNDRKTLKSGPICHGAGPKLSWRELVLMQWLSFFFCCCCNFFFFMFFSDSLRWNAHFIKVMEDCCGIRSPHECKVGLCTLRRVSVRFECCTAKHLLDQSLADH